MLLFNGTAPNFQRSGGRSRHLLNHTSGVRHYHGASRDKTNAERRTLDAKIEQEEKVGFYKRYTDTILPLDAFKSAPPGL